MHSYLERESFQLLEASSDEEAESIAAAYHQTIHLLVADVIMPGRNGRSWHIGCQHGSRISKSYLSRDTSTMLSTSCTGRMPELLLKPFPGSELVGG
jgi:hypothetical protein